MYKWMDGIELDLNHTKRTQHEICSFSLTQDGAAVNCSYSEDIISSRFFRTKFSFIIICLPLCIFQTWELIMLMVKCFWLRNWRKYFIPIVIPTWCLVQIAWFILIIWLQIAVEIKLGLIAFPDAWSTYNISPSILNVPDAIQSHRA